MKKVLIIGASILQLPAIRKAKELGYYVGVADYNPNAIGVSYADEYFNVSTIDIEGIVEVAKKFQPDGIMTLATDMPMRAVAASCQELALPGISPETALKATDKGEMIKAFEEHEVAHPWYFIAPNQTDFDKIKCKVTYPCIMKPTDNAGSRGVVLAHSLEELEKEYSYTVGESRNGGIIIEEYMEGAEVSVEIMVVNSEPHILQVTDKITTGAPHFVEMGHTQPSRLGEDNVAAIKDLAVRAVKAVGIQNGPAHVEIMLTKEGPKMVELGARMGGDCITTHLVPLSTGIDMVRSTMEIACGQETDIEPKCNKGSAIRYFKTQESIIKNISGVEEARTIPGVQEITFVKNVGDRVGNIDSSVDRVGFVIAQGDNADEAEDICERALELIKIIVE